MVGGSSETSSSLLPASDGSIASHPHLCTNHWMLSPIPPMVKQHNGLPPAVTAEYQNHNISAQNVEDHHDEDSFYPSTSSVGALSDVMGTGNDISSNLNHDSSAKNVEDHNDEDSFSLLFFKRSVGALSDAMGMSYDINQNITIALTSPASLDLWDAR